MTALRVITTTLFVALLAPALPLSGQEGLDISGRVTDLSSGRPISGLIITIVGTEAATATDRDGTYRLATVPLGEWVVRVEHADYGTHEHPLVASVIGAVVVDIRLHATAMELEVRPLPLPTAAPPNRVDVRRRGTVVEGERLREAAATSATLGDLIQRTIPALRRRDLEDFAGNELCLEFRGVGARTARTGCNSPSVFFDRVPVQDATLVYSMANLSNLTLLQALSPGEQGAQYGSTPYGVLLIETVRAELLAPLGLGRPGGAGGSRRKTFDWAQDPQGHSFGKTFAGAFVGNAVGLLSGIAIGRKCIFVDEHNNLDRTCSPAGVAGVGVAAVALPALGAALGTQWAGRTELSHGNFGAAMLGAGFGLLPGYIFSLSTVGGGVQATNIVGQVFLVVATPVFATFADRLYRKLRGSR